VRDTVIKVVNWKEGIIPVEFSLVREWSETLESKLNGCCWVYVQLQSGVNREEGNDKQGRSWISVAVIAKRCGLSTRQIFKILNILEEYKFIRRTSGKQKGVSNEYEILSLPGVPVRSRKKKEIEDIEIKDVSPAKPESVFETGTDKLKEMYLEKARIILEELAAKDEWNASDVIKFYKQYYVICYGFKSSEYVTAKEGNLIRLLIEGYGLQETIDVIKHALENWSKIEYLNGYPSIAAIYGFKDSLFAEYKGGKLKTKGQYQSKKGKVGSRQWQ
jgi:hypothetical protein